MLFSLTLLGQVSGIKGQKVFFPQSQSSDINDWKDRLLVERGKRGGSECVLFDS